MRKSILPLALLLGVSSASAALNISLNNIDDWTSTNFTSVGESCYSPAYGDLIGHSFSGAGDSISVSWNFTEGSTWSPGLAVELRLSDNDSPQSNIHTGTYWNRSSDDLWLSEQSYSDGASIATFAPTVQYLGTAPANNQSYESITSITMLSSSSYAVDRYLKNTTTGQVLVDTQDGNSATGSTINWSNPGLNSDNFDIRFGALTTKSTACFDHAPEPSAALLSMIAGLALAGRRRR